MSLRTQLLGAFAYVLLLIIVALEVPLALNLARRINAEVKNETATQAFLVAANASGRMDRPQRLAQVVRDAGSDLGARVIVVGPSPRARLLADSTASRVRPLSYASRPEIKIRDGERPRAGERHSDTLGQDLLYTAVPVTNEGKVVGVVRVTQSLEAVHSKIRRGVLALVAIGAFALVVGLALAWFLADSLSRPLRGLAATARRVESGDLEARAKVTGATEQREVATAFNDMAERLGLVLAAQREFVANASHQLRTPLTGLRLRLELARMKADRGADAVPELEAAEREVERLARLLTSLLTLAREGDKPRASGPVSLAHAAERACERWAATAEEEGRELELVGGEDATISASEEDLAILLDNLIENALRYSPSRVAVDWGRDGKEAWLAVLDEGPGLAPARRRRCSSASRAGAPAATVPEPGSASRSCRRSPAAGAGGHRSPTGPKAGRAPRCASRPRLQWRRSHGSRHRRSAACAAWPALRRRHGVCRLRRLARLGGGAGDAAPAEAPGAHAGAGAREARPPARDHPRSYHARDHHSADDHRRRPSRPSRRRRQLGARGRRWQRQRPRRRRLGRSRGGLSARRAPPSASRARARHGRGARR
jgi:signal transduction histidine kinase